MRENRSDLMPSSGHRARSSSGHPVPVPFGPPVRAQFGPPGPAQFGPPGPAYFGPPVRATSGHPVRPTSGHPVRPTSGHPVRPTSGRPVRAQFGHPVRAQFGPPGPASSGSAAWIPQAALAVDPGRPEPAMDVVGAAAHRHPTGPLMLLALAGQAAAVHDAGGDRPFRSCRRGRGRRGPRTGAPAGLGAWSRSPRCGAGSARADRAGRW